ncbi:MAG: hypothetical protein ACMXYF_05650 [Candidatus Woesearchaeota archaeon]
MKKILLLLLLTAIVGCASTDTNEQSVQQDVDQQPNDSIPLDNQVREMEQNPPTIPLQDDVLQIERTGEQYQVNYNITLEIVIMQFDFPVMISSYSFHIDDFDQLHIVNNQDIPSRITIPTLNVDVSMAEDTQTLIPVTYTQGVHAIYIDGEFIDEFEVFSNGR